MSKRDVVLALGDEKSALYVDGDLYKWWHRDFDIGRVLEKMQPFTFRSLRIHEDWASRRSGFPGDLNDVEWHDSMVEHDFRESRLRVAYHQALDEKIDMADLLTEVARFLDEPSPVFEPKEKLDAKV